MKNRIKKIVPICLMMTFLVTSCSKKSNDTSASELVSNNSVVSSSETSSQSVSSIYRPVELPNTIDIFSSDVKAYLEGKPIDQFINVEGDSQPVKAFALKNEGKEYTLKLSLKDDLSNALEVKSSASEIKLTNFYAYTTYYYGIYNESNELVGNVQSFSTSYGPRILNVDGISNVRDIGAYAYGEGKFLKQGLVYRGTEADQHYAITEKGVKTFKEDLNIKYDLDLRSDKESASATKSAFAEDLPYKRISLSGYNNCTASKQLSLYKEAFQVFANKDNYPIYFHCYQGADRTGTIAYILEALMGVSEEDMKVDFELTTFTDTTSDTYRDSDKSKDTSHNYHLIKANIMALYKADTLQESIEKYMIEGLKLTQEEVNSIKSILSGNEDINVGAIASVVGE